MIEILHNLGGEYGIAGLQLLDWELYVLLVLAIVIGTTVHEYGHALMADRLGDKGPRTAGRVTLNPLAHLDPLGTMLLLATTLVGYPIGWGKAVKTDPEAYTMEPRHGVALVAFAGPLMNLLTAFLLAPVARFFLDGGGRIGPVGFFLFALTIITMLVNLSLFTFNLVPIHPLDGSHIVAGALPTSAATLYTEFMQKYGVYVFLLLMVSGTLPKIVGPVVVALFRLLIGR